MHEEGHRLVITVIGKDRIGIIAAISQILAEASINILDINQTIMQGIFTMTMVVDARKSRIDVAELSGKLADKGSELGLVITTQHEDVFRFMHRI
ncbi:MAG: ACT domain-containing protein [Syntrophomonadaceae bacterium]|nr:ACT domain-containing protein [Syntrophomonadaceae bacterium]